MGQRTEDSHGKVCLVWGQPLVLLGEVGFGLSPSVEPRRDRGNCPVDPVFRWMRDFRGKSLPVSEGEMGAGRGSFDRRAFQLPLPRRTGHVKAEP